VRHLFGIGKLKSKILKLGLLNSTKGKNMSHVVQIGMNSNQDEEHRSIKSKNRAKRFWIFVTISLI